MPRYDGGSGGFRGAIRAVLDEVGAVAGGAVRDFVRQAVPLCTTCGRPVHIPLRCLLCGGYGCPDHTMYHARKFAICFNCLKANGIEIDLGDMVDEGSPAGGQGGVDDFPWDVLDIPPTRDEEAIKRAYFAKAKIYHPDRGGTQQQFNYLQAAYDAALAEARGR